MRYEKPEINWVESALEAVEGSTTKSDFFLESSCYYGTAAAYEADE